MAYWIKPISLLFLIKNEEKYVIKEVKNNNFIKWKEMIM